MAEEPTCEQIESPSSSVSEEFEIPTSTDPEEKKGYRCLNERDYRDKGSHKRDYGRGN